MREQIAAREQVEQLLQEARATIQTLETQLAHERIAKDEAVRRIEDERQAIERQLEEERAARQQAEQERDVAVAGRRDAVGRLQEVMAVREAQKSSGAAVSANRGEVSDATTGRKVASDLEIIPARSADDTATVKQARRRGRPPKVRQPESEFVEWWVPGWKDRLR